MGIFGWDLPPGCSHRDIEEACGGGNPCEVCGEFEDDCICPECPECNSVGDPLCYKQHGLKRSENQIISLAWSEAIWEERNRNETESIEQLIKETENAKPNKIN
jgi:hypothetical protein